MTRDVRAGRRTFLSGAGALTLALALAACSSPGSDSDSSGGEAASGGGGLPDTIKIMDINGLTGPVAFAGSNAAKGIDLAIEQIEADGLLGETTIEVDSKDAAADPQEAASFASQAIADQSYAAILGPSASAQSAAVSPIVAAGRHADRLRPGRQRRRHRRRLHLPAHPAGRVLLRHRRRLHRRAGRHDGVVLFNAGNPTLAQLGPGDGARDGRRRTASRCSGSAGVEVTAQDFTTVGLADRRREARTPPSCMLTGPQYPVAITQLRRPASPARSSGCQRHGRGQPRLRPARPRPGAVWPTNFTADQTDESSQTFVKAYKAKYDGEVPEQLRRRGLRRDVVPRPGHRRGRQRRPRPRSSRVWPPSPTRASTAPRAQ